MAIVFVLYIVWLSFFCKAKEVDSLKSIIQNKCFYPPHLILSKVDREQARRNANLISVIFWVLLLMGVVLGFIFT